MCHVCGNHVCVRFVELVDSGEAQTELAADFLLCATCSRWLFMKQSGQNWSMQYVLYSQPVVMLHDP